MARRRWKDTWDDFELWMGLHGFSREVRFRGATGKRQYRWDFAREDMQIAVEYDGLGRGKEDSGERGGHETRSGLMRDAAKSNEAQLLGWKVIRCHAPTIEDGSCMVWVEDALACLKRS